MKSLFNLFSFRKSYEFYLLEGVQSVVNNNAKKMQNEGWELAGQITTQYYHGEKRMIIPFKRRTKC